MEGKRLIKKIRLRNILSFGERRSGDSIQSKEHTKEHSKLFRLPLDLGEIVELEPLNIIIGQNASGKSNLVDVIKLLRSLPEDKGLVNFISRNGGISEWIWKGKKDKPIAEIEVCIIWLFVQTIYKIKFLETIQRLGISEETISEKNKVINRSEITKAEDSMLSVNEPDYRGASYTTIRNAFHQPIIYSDLQTNRKNEIRKPQPSDARNDFLAEDGSNLALVLNDLEHRGDTKDKIIENLKKFYPRVKDYSVRVLGGTVQLFVREKGLEKPISAIRLSDGTLRYLCLLAILCHPEPPPLICIEEPEVGLHPDILPTIAELMIEASQRTQLIVTTHSDILVSAFSDVPEAVLVCEKDEEGTHFKRLDKENLKEWLNEYSLGELWLKGEIGGTRW